MTEKKNDASFLDRFLDGFERVANLLPTPFTIFGFFFILTAIVSFFVSGVSDVSPSTQETITIQNFLSMEGIHWLLQNLITNYTSYAPLGVVLVMTIGIGLCEETGLLTQLIEKMLRASETWKMSRPQTTP